MADKKGQILIRFPDALAADLRRVSHSTRTPIKDIVSSIVASHLSEWAIAQSMSYVARSADEVMQDYVRESDEVSGKYGQEIARITDLLEEVKAVAGKVRESATHHEPTLPIEPSR